jgi:uncharacterized repeat protein (TIGR04052 family)
MYSRSVRADAAAILLPALVLFIAALSACSGSGARPVSIRFDAVQGGEGAALRNLQFYVHDLELIDEDGKPHRFALNATPPWQSEQVALVDLAGDAVRRNSTLTGTIDPTARQRFVALRFKVGVPFALNHGNPLTAAAPLDRADLFWTWQGGHKFLRVDLAADGREWSFHLGSTGCSSASALRPPGTPCAQPNEMTMRLDGDPLAQVVRFDPASLVAAARSSGHVACTGAYAEEPACANAFASTGLQAASGFCANGVCERQTLWSLAPSTP